MNRSHALDVFRGFTIALMMLVNNPGSWDYVYAPLRHADWHGLTPTDLVFPFFLFIVGSAMYFALRKVDFVASGVVVRKVLRRSLLIFTIGVLLNAYPFTAAFDSWRFMGVLQRIALAYAAAAMLVLLLRRHGLIVASAVILLGYWAILVAFGGEHPYALQDSLIARIDVALLGATHLWTGRGVPFDPEGLLSTLPAIVNVLVGFETTRFLSTQADAAARVRTLVALGLAALVVGGLWAFVFPVNKSLWTSSYVLVSSGIALLTLALFIWMTEVKAVTRVLEPLRIYGLNPLFLYIVSWLWVASYALVDVADGKGGQTDLQTRMFELLQTVASPLNASLIFALAHVLLFWLIAYGLYRRDIVIKL